MWAALCEKASYVLNQCHTKRRTGVHGRVHPSFDMTLTFQEKKIQNFQKVLKSRCHTKRRVGTAMRAYPSLGMTTTQDISYLFSKTNKITKNPPIQSPHNPGHSFFTSGLSQCPGFKPRHDVGSTCRHSSGGVSVCDEKKTKNVQK